MARSRQAGERGGRRRTSLIRCCHRKSDLSPPHYGTGKIRPAARTRKNLGAPSKTAAVLGNGRPHGHWGPGCVPSGMWCALLLGAWWKSGA
jgi:hypothetical protein